MSGMETIPSQHNSARAVYPKTTSRTSANESDIHALHPGAELARTKQALAMGRPRPTLSGNKAARYHVLKRSLDIALCVAVLPVALPILAVSALAVRLTSPGPVLFVQQRAGRGGKPFSILKMRTMVADAESQKAALKERSEIDGPDFKMTDDPRVTRVGSILRKTSLDELPQIWNVLKGDMSLVGPRPTSFGMDTYERWHTERLEVQPGVTGLWQVRLRGDTDFCERVRLDITYVRRRSLSLDLWILLQTLPSVLLKRGAF